MHVDSKCVFTDWYICTSLKHLILNLQDVWPFSELHSKYRTAMALTSFICIAGAGLKSVTAETQEWCSCEQIWLLKFAKFWNIAQVSVQWNKCEAWFHWNLSCRFVSVMIVNKNGERKNLFLVFLMLAVDKQMALWNVVVNSFRFYFFLF